MTEFDIINHYFAKDGIHRSDVCLGIGDDAAVVQAPPGHELVITTDTLIAGTHFPLTTHAFDIGYKSLAVNLSDLAAMGATPTWVTMALCLPNEDKTWLHDFCQGFFTLANRHHVQLIGGDLTCGPLTIAITAMGCIPQHMAIKRSTAQPGDLIFVTGTLGDAGLALQVLQKKITLDPAYEQAIFTRFNRPEPRVVCGEKLRGLAHAAIDISDGLAADLNHLLAQSRVGAIVYVDQLPLSLALQHLHPITKGIELALISGDDYELCFTIPPEKRGELEAIVSSIPLTCIGEISAQAGLELRHNDGSLYHGPVQGYQHF